MSNVAVLLEPYKAVYVEVPKVACSSIKIVLAGHPIRGVAYCLARFDVFRPEMSFAEFVRAVADIPDDDADDHFKSQRTFVSNSDGYIAVDFIGRFEDLNTDFSRVGELIGMPPLLLPRVQATATRRRYAEFYSPETRAIVATRFHEDISLFGYGFSGA